MMRRFWHRITRSRTSLAITLTLGLIILAGAGGGVYAALNGGSNSQASLSSAINLDKGLVGHWSFNGNLNDSTPYRDSATAIGAIPSTDRKGTANNAYSFNGTSDYINVPNRAQLNPAKITVSLWFNASNPLAGATQGMVSKDQGGSVTNPPYEIRISGNGKPTFNIAHTDSSIDSVTAPSAVAANTWYHAVGTNDGTNLVLYLNGSQVATVPATDVMATTGASLKIGQQKITLNRFFGGTIDDVRIYNRAITAAEAAALYKNYDTAVKLDSGAGGLIGEWKMDGNAKDSTPYKNNAITSTASLTTDRKGKANSAYNFNGTSSYLKAPTVTSFQPTQTMSAGIWFKVNDLNAVGGQKLFSTTQVGGYAITIHEGSTSVGCQGTSICFLVYVNNAYAVAQVPKSTLSTGVWYQAYGTYDGSAVKLYINGNLVATTPASGAITYNAATVLCIGSEFGGSSSCTGGDYFGGSLDDMRLYNRALSADEIKQQYDSYNSTLQINNLSKGLVGDWAFNGNANDSTPYRNNGIVSNALLAADRKGRTNSAYSFDGATTTHITVGDTDIPNTITVSAWVYPTAANQAAKILAKHSDTTNVQGTLQLSSNGKPGFELTTGGVYTALNSSVVLPLNQWSLVTGTYDGSVAIIWINGVNTGTANKTGALANTNFPWTIGRMTTANGSAASFIGSIDDVRIYSRALSASEISALYGSYR